MASKSSSQVNVRTPDDIRNGEPVIGYEVAITGNPDPESPRRVLASIIVVIGKPQ